MIFTHPLKDHLGMTKEFTVLVDTCLQNSNYLPDYGTNKRGGNGLRLKDSFEERTSPSLPISSNSGTILDSCPLVDRLSEHYRNF